MAKFCSNCGKELAQGICDCRQINNEITSSLLEIIKGIFTKPIDTIKQYTKENNFIIAIIVIGVMSIISGLLSMSILKNAYSLIFSTSSLYAYNSFAIELPYAKTFFTTTILVFALSFAYAGILYLVNTIIFKGNGNFKEIYTLTGITSIINTTALALASILLFINVYIGIIIILLSSLLVQLYNYHGIKFIGPKDENKYGYIYLVTTIIYYIVLFIIFSILV